MDVMVLLFNIKATYAAVIAEASNALRANSSGSLRVMERKKN